MAFARFLMATLVAMTVPFGCALAQSYPDKPVSLIIQFAPGTTTDLVGRRFGELLAKELGTTVVAQNRAARVPEAVKLRLDAAARKVLTDPAVVAEMREKLSTLVVHESGAAYAGFVREQYEFYRDFLKTLKLD